MGLTGPSGLLWKDPPPEASPAPAGGAAGPPAQPEEEWAFPPTTGNDGPALAPPDLVAALDRVNAAWLEVKAVCPGILRKAASYAWGHYEEKGDLVGIARFASWCEELVADIASARYLCEKLALAGKQVPFGLEPSDFADKAERQSWKDRLDLAWRKYGKDDGGTLPTRSLLI